MFVIVIILLLFEVENWELNEEESEKLEDVSSKIKGSVDKSKEERRGNNGGEGEPPPNTPLPPYLFTYITPIQIFSLSSSLSNSKATTTIYLKNHNNYNFDIVDYQ